jgi:hypothetical protein
VPSRIATRLPPCPSPHHRLLLSMVADLAGTTLLSSVRSHHTSPPTRHMRSKLTEPTSETVQDEFPTSSSFATVRMIHSPPHVRSASLPSSPVSALPSPPDSPSGGSVSSLPSIGSSFFYSSAAASPPHIHASDEPPEDYALRLVIPSLTLPARYLIPHRTVRHWEI